MNKLIKHIFLPLALLTFASPAFAMEANNLNDAQENKECEETKFELFEQLPTDMQNIIVDHAWQELNKDEQFVQQLKSLEITPTQALYFETEFPIYFNTINNNKYSFEDRIGLLEQDEFTNVAQVNFNNKNYNFNVPFSNLETVQACSLSIHGDLAIAWQDNKKNYESPWKITFINLEDIKNGKEIDTSKQSITIKRSPINNCLRGILFNMQGTKLGISFGVAPYKYKKDTHDESELLIIDAPSKNKNLNIDQIAKRLNIPTSGAKKELEKNRSSNNN